MHATHSPALYVQQVGRITRIGTFEIADASRAFASAFRAAENGHPVKLGKEPGQPWTVTVGAKP